MNNDIHSPHDKLFKAAFSQKTSAIGYLRGYLPNDIKQIIDFDTLEIYPGDYVDQALSGSSSDLVYKVQINCSTAYLYLLFEHQSTPEPMMAYRLLKYMVRLWEAVFKEQNDLKILPPILPLVLYQGKSVWRSPLNFIDLIDFKQRDLTPYLPQFQYLLVDLVREEGDAIAGDVYGRVVLHLMKAVAEGTLLKTLELHGGLIRELLTRDNALDLLETLFRYTLNTDDSIDIDSLTRVVKASVNKDTGEFVMTLAEKLEQQGIKKGMQKGIEDVVLSMLKEGVDIAFISRVTGLSLKAIETLHANIPAS